MALRDKRWFRNLAVAGVVAAVMMVGVWESVQAAAFTLWLHIPLAAVVLGLLSIGALSAGAAWAEYQGRSVADREQTH